MNTNDFTVSVTPNPVSAGVGYPTVLTVTVTPQNGFAEGVNLACGNLPIGGELHLRPGGDCQRRGHEPADRGDDGTP